MNRLVLRAICKMIDALTQSLDELTQTVVDRVHVRLISDAIKALRSARKSLVTILDE